jgi:cobalamin synthase
MINSQWLIVNMAKTLKMLTDFALAWRLLTIIPLPFIPTDSNRPAGLAAAYYPLVGLILGLRHASGAVGRPDRPTPP